MPTDPPTKAAGSYRLLSVIVPVFNERNTVAEIVRRMRSVELPLDREIIVVDDGSTDGTDRILINLEDSTLRLLRHPDNQGKAAAVRTGLGQARGDLVLIQDADLEYDPDDWPMLLKPVLRGRADVVFGTRFRGGARQAMPIGQWVGNRALAAATNVLFGTSLSDLQTGYKLFDRKVLDGLGIETAGFDLEPELTAKVLRSGHRIFEVPISFAARRANEGRKFRHRDWLRSLWTIVRLRFSPRP